MIYLSPKLIAGDPTEIVIAVDIDNVLNNLGEAWCNWLNKTHDTNVTYEDVTEWDISRFFPSLTTTQVFEPLYNEAFWETVKPKAGAVEYMEKLIHDGYNVYLCTDTNYRNVKMKYEKVIKRYFPFISWEKVIVANKKQMVLAHIMIDDNPNNLSGGDYLKILMSAPHNLAVNAELNSMCKCETWEEVYGLISQITKGYIKKTYKRRKDELFRI